MKVKALSVLPILCVYWSNVQNTSANDTAFGGTASSPYPIHTQEIRMVSEEITIKSDAKDGAWIYNCDFVFKNVSDKSVELMMGMPFSRRTASEDEMLSIPRSEKVPEKGQPIVWDFKTFVNGKKLRSTRVKPVVNPQIPDFEYKVAYTWPIRFRPGAVHKVRNTYKLAYTGDSNGYLYAEYILKTGGLWHDGTIGRSRLKVILDDPGYILHKENKNPSYPYIRPEGYKVSSKGNKITIDWDLKMFKPTQDLEVRFQDRLALLVFSDILNRHDFSGLDREELRRLRNIPYALYGYTFKDPELKKYFATKWYVNQNKDFSESLFSKDVLSYIQRVKDHESKLDR